MHSPYRYTTQVIDRTDNLFFKPVTFADIPRLQPYFANFSTRSCDYTVGGIVIWRNLFRYEYCIYENTLFLKSLSEDGSGRTAFLVPIGDLSIERCIDILKEYCQMHDMPLILTAVPEDILDNIVALNPSNVIELTNWADYIYDAQALSTLNGKHYNKKRNHVNRFIKDNPGYSLEIIDKSNIEAVKHFFSTLGIESAKADEDMADFEWHQCNEVLENISQLNFTGACLRDGDGNIVAFTFGEIIGDTLVLHIEKIEHLVPGAGETINKLFAEYMTLVHPELKFINREDDAGDPGLRYAKESYHPLYLLKKFNVEF